MHEIQQQDDAGEQGRNADREDGGNDENLFGTEIVGQQELRCFPEHVKERLSDGDAHEGGNMQRRDRPRPRTM